jgi:5S rRNA maturation endonuclease (ribonuclease M5)
VIFHGRFIEPVSLWSRWVDFPPDMNKRETFSPLVRCPNPNHQTQKRHFQVNLVKPLVHCFAGCGISGTYEHAVATILDLRRKDGELDERAARAAILRGSRVASAREAAPRSELGVGTRKSLTGDELGRDVERLERGEFSYLGRRCVEYLERRGIDQDARQRWRVGWDEQLERVVIPAQDERGTLRFLIRRAIDDRSQPKYLYTKGYPKTSILFGACSIDREQVRSLGLILCEGPLDVIRLHQNGYRSAVAILGTGISKKQARLVDMLRPKRVYLIFDRNAAGVVNVVKAVESLRKQSIFVCRYSTDSEADDPATMSRKEVERSVARALPAAQFMANPKLTSLKRQAKGKRSAKDSQRPARYQR